MSQRKRSLGGRKRLLASVAALPLAAMILSACSASPEAEQPIPETSEPVVGGTLRYLVSSEAASLDNTTLSATALSSLGSRAYAIYDALVLQDNATGEIEFGTAESVETDDSITWTIKLKPGVEFSDGTPYDAEAVKFNFERHANPDSNSRFMTEAKLIGSMEVIDELTLDVTLVQAEAQWPQRLASGMNFIGSPTAMEAMGEEFGSAPVGAGAFTVAEWRRDDRLILERNANYYGESPYLDALEIRVIPDAAQRLSTLQTGAADMSMVNDFGQVPQAEAAGLIVDETIVSGGSTITLNHTVAPFDDIRVRKAVQLALDRDDLNTVVFGGHAVIPETLFVETSPFYDASASYPKPDPEEAKRLIEEYVAEKGEPLKFSLTGSAAGQLLAEYLQNSMAQVGAEVELNLLQGPQVQGAAFSGDFQAITLSMAFIDPVPILHEQERTGGGRNFGSFSNSIVDEALTSAAATSDTSERKANYLTVQNEMIEQVSELITSRIASFQAHTSEVQGLKYIEDGVPRWELVYLSK